MEYIDAPKLPSTPVSESLQKLFLRFAFAMNDDKLPNIVNEDSNVPKSAEANSKVIDNIVDVPVWDTPAGDIPVGATNIDNIVDVPVGLPNTLKVAEDSVPRNVAKNDLKVIDNILDFQGWLCKN
jgi:hypothetical protein